MGFSRLLIISTILVFLTCSPTSETASNLLNLVYKGCSNQTINTGFEQNLRTLFASLISRASTSKFFDTTSGNSPNSVMGLFQCRGDLSNGDCFNCVNQLCDKVNRVCGKTTAARVQFQGCYLHYETAGFPQTPDSRLLYSTCNSIQAADVGFEQRRKTAFGNLESGILGGIGFSTVSYGSVYVLAQCQGDLGVADCGECVKTAIASAETQCGDSISGQVYYQRCYVSYSYYPSGVSRKEYSGSSQETGKTVAIVIGGAAGLFLLFAFLCFIRSLWKKKDGY